MTEPKAPERYLLALRGNHAVGLEHETKLFSLFLSVAAALNRTAVIPPLRLSPRHNLDSPVDNDPRTYFNLDTMSYDGRPIPYVMASEFDAGRFAPSEVKEITPVNVHPPPNTQNRYYFNTAECEAHRLIEFTLSLNACLYIDGELVKFPCLHYSSLVHTRALQTIELMLGRKNETPRYFDFCCVKVRRRDMLGFYGLWQRTRRTAMLKALASARNVKANLLRRGFVDKNSVIYLMSDEPRLNYFDALYKEYPRFHTLKDFPELLRLRHPDPPGQPNNHLLYAIEKQMFKVAGTRFLWGDINRQSPTNPFKSRSEFKRLRGLRPRAPEEQRTVLLQQSGLLKPLLWLVAGMLSYSVRITRRYFTRRLKKKT